MLKEKEILSNLIIFSKYAKYRDDLKRRETWEEIVSRYVTMMVKKYPVLEKEIVLNKRKLLACLIVLSFFCLFSLSKI